MRPYIHIEDHPDADPDERFQAHLTTAVFLPKRTITNTVQIAAAGDIITVMDRANGWAKNEDIDPLTFKVSDHPNGFKAVVADLNWRAVR